MRNFRWTVIVVVGFVGLIVIAVVACHASMQHRIAQEVRITSSNGTNEAKAIDVNGAQEWITIRGQNRDDPRRNF